MFGIEAAFEGRPGRSPELKMVKGGTMAMTTLAVAVDEAPPKEGHDTKSTRVPVRPSAAVVRCIGCGSSTQMPGSWSIAPALRRMPSNPLKTLVPPARLELARPCEQQILSLFRTSFREFSRAFQNILDAAFSVG